ETGDAAPGAFRAASASVLELLGELQQIAHHGLVVGRLASVAGDAPRHRRRVGHLRERLLRGQRHLRQAEPEPYGAVRVRIVLGRGRSLAQAQVLVADPVEPRVRPPGHLLLGPEAERHALPLRLVAQDLEQAGYRAAIYAALVRDRDAL